MRASYPVKIASIVVFASVLLSSLGQATTYNLSGTSGLWSTTATWSPSGTPGSADSITTTGSVSSTVGLDASKTITNFSPGSSGKLTFTDQFAGGTPILTVSGNYLQTAGTVEFGAGTGLNVTGTTRVYGAGLLLLDSTYTLTGNINLGSGSNGIGTIGLTAGDFSRTIGTGSGQIQITSLGGGFAAFGADRSVTFNSGAAVTSVTSLSKLFLGHSTSTHTATVTNGFTSVALRVEAVDGLATIDGALSGNLSGTTSLTKTGAGVLALTGSNSNSADMTIQAGTLLLNSANAKSGASRIVISAGFLGLGVGDLNTNLGNAGVVTTGTTGSGFAAFGADRSVNFDSGATINWGAVSFNFFYTNLGSILLLNSAESDYKLTFQNAINLNGAERTITVGNGSAAIDAAMTGILSGTGASALRKAGTGTLELTNANTYAGGTTIAAGALLANNNPLTGSATGAGAVALAAGATLGGTGKVSGLVTTAGTTSTFSPGSSSGTTEGTLTLSGGIDARAGTTFNFSLGTTSDLLSLGSGEFTGSTASGGLLFNIADAGGLQTGIAYTLINFGSHTGLELTDLTMSSIAAGFIYDSFHFTINSTSLQVEFTSSLIPEPSTYAALVGVAALGLGLLRRRRTTLT